MSKENCPECEGTGMMECSLEYGDEHPEECPGCGGEEMVTCIECEGTGEVDSED